MTQANTARREGDDFQARQFWLRASRLLDSESPIVRVGFESGPRSYDDIWVEYDRGRGPRTLNGKVLLREHIQCKWHLTPGSYGYRQLIDPDFINAEKMSLLQRAHSAHLTHGASGDPVQFTLLTNWQPDQNDPLRAIMGTRSGAIRVERLFDTKTDNSKTGAVRKEWREHLSLDDEALRQFAGMLAFRAANDSLDDYRDQLDTLFGLVGLRRIATHESAFPYDDVVYKWLGQGRLEFDRASFRRVCEDEGLITHGGTPRPILYGVKSFNHPVDRLEDRCIRVLDFVPDFDERYIRDEAEWSRTLYPSLKRFLLQAAQESDRPRLVLDAHSTLAFAAGSVLNTKIGRVIELEQRSPARQIWAADDANWDPAWPKFELTEIVIDATRPEIAVAVSATHDIAADAKSYIEDSLPIVGRLLVFRPSGGSGPTSVVNGRHAFELAISLASQVKANGSAASGQTTHLFVAAPNALTFYLGQHQLLMGRVCFYEFDFDGAHGRSYRSSLTLPVARTNLL
ncbi:TPA: SAVED domain-containing protein [Stenotrophomonas maltophilia]|nr:SAVED domain-containing protein [Stenotrophomonas maltophilia]